MTALPPDFAPAAGDSFVLLDDARVRGARPARLYLRPQETIIARTPNEVLPALHRIAALARAGHHLAGVIAYEAGLALEPHLAPLADARSGGDGPLVWFGAFAGYHAIAAGDMPAWLAARARPGLRSAIGPLEPQLSIGGYAQRFAALRERIAAGDIYQANFTLPQAGSWRGDPLAIYAGLRAASASGYGGIVYDGQDWLLSFSPEMFFSLRGDEVVTRPMKGTRPRGQSGAQDRELAEALASSAKDRAENLMIVDLLRNDLSRVARPGSVQVDAAFAIETYPTLHQMVSTVRARLSDGQGAAALLRALFPCGSVTGAPKIRAMELIAAQERDPRGAYCGAIGRLDPPHQDNQDAGEAAFNVAIRTLRLTGAGQGSGGRAVMGVGSALVADSALMPEWRECLSKGGFVRESLTEGVTADPQQAGPRAGAAPQVAQFDLIETIHLDGEGCFPLLDRHLARLSASAAALGFACSPHALRNAVHALCMREAGPARLRLVLARSGAYCLEVAAMPPALPDPVPCVVLPLPVDPGDWRLRHKTSDRSFYEAGLGAAQGAGASEALFLRDDGLLTEGCFSNIFAARGGIWLTPPARLGLLPGVLRAAMLDNGRAREAELRLDDLADGFAIGNALRGLMPARLMEHDA